MISDLRGNQSAISESTSNLGHKNRKSVAHSCCGYWKYGPVEAGKAAHSPAIRMESLGGTVPDSIVFDSNSRFWPGQVQPGNEFSCRPDNVLRNRTR